MKKKIVLCSAAIVCALLLAGFLYVSDYYHASEEVQSCLSETESVKVLSISEGLLLDGPGEDAALVFYPGGKVEYTAYLPLLRRIAADGTDCFLVKMPMNLAILGKNKAEALMDSYHYQSWFVGGHSLGGAAAAMFAADHDLNGLILLAAYPTSAVDEQSLELYGSEDRVLNREKRSAGDAFLPEGSVVEVIEGGNHAQFGNYGAQKGDGEAAISREEQQTFAARKITQFIHEDTLDPRGHDRPAKKTKTP